MEFQLTPGPPVKSILYPLDLQHIVIYDRRRWRFHRKSALFIPGAQKAATKATSKSKVANFLPLHSWGGRPVLVLQQILPIRQSPVSAFLPPCPLPLLLLMMFME